MCSTVLASHTVIQHFGIPVLMSAAVVLAAVLGGGVLFIARRIFCRRKALKLLSYPAGLMRGKTVIVTGANCGIGKATAAELLKLQARVIMACRDRQRAEEAARDIKNQAGPNQGEIVIKHLDLASLQSVHSFCEEVIRVCLHISPSLSVPETVLHELHHGVCIN